MPHACCALIDKPLFKCVLQSIRVSSTPLSNAPGSQRICCGISAYSFTTLAANSRTFKSRPRTRILLRLRKACDTISGDLLQHGAVCARGNVIRFPGNWRALLVETCCLCVFHSFEPSSLSSFWQL